MVVLELESPTTTACYLNDAFWRWFGDSKVVDADGTPLVVYHGTVADFSAFKHGDVGFHFGSVSAGNNRIEYTKSGDGEKIEPQCLLPVYLSIKNPLRMADVGDWGNPDIVAAFVADMVITDDNFAVRYEAAEADIRASSNPLNDFRRVFERMGYDGIVYDNVAEGGGDSYIAFRPEQIKSATGNRGTFDPRDPDITH